MNSRNLCTSHSLASEDSLIEHNKKKLKAVMILSAFMMAFEIGFGYWTGSMALLADGWHMAAHLAALSIGWLAYHLTQSKKMNQNFSFGAGKIIPLGGYTSGIFLGLIAVTMIGESILRFFKPNQINFFEAIIVAIIGLVVNIISILLLRRPRQEVQSTDDHVHHSGHLHDHNMQGAYAHVVADLLTSVLAVIGLVICQRFDMLWIDAAIGILGALIILKWSYEICSETGWELLDGHSKVIDQEKLSKIIQSENAEVVDLHIWRIAPKAIACELVLKTAKLRGAQYYREKISKVFDIQHLVIEEILKS